jgi:hypothetical protein
MEVMAMTITTQPHEVHRLAIAVGAGFDESRDRYEQNVPSLDTERLAALVREGADCDKRVFAQSTARQRPAPARRQPCVC